MSGGGRSFDANVAFPLDIVDGSQLGSDRGVDADMNEDVELRRGQ